MARRLSKKDGDVGAWRAVGPQQFSETCHTCYEATLSDDEKPRCGLVSRLAGSDKNAALGASPALCYLFCAIGEKACLGTPTGSAAILIGELETDSASTPKKRLSQRDTGTAGRAECRTRLVP